MSYKSPKWNNGSAPPLSAENMQALTDAVQEQGETLETMCNPNMLDNWYFGNPVNQRGQTSYTGAGYGIDRWKTGDGVATTVANGALNISYSTPGWNLVEPLDNMLVPGATYTLSCIYKASVNPIRLVVAWGSSAFFYNEASPISDDWALAQITGTIPANATISFNQVVIQSLGSSAGSFSLKAVKLELGSQQTLAHQDANGNWELNEIPDYGEQLRRCQRYLIPLNNWTRVRVSYYSGTALFFAVPIPATMRTTPAILDPSGALVVQSVSGTDQTDFTFECNMSTPGSIGVRAAKNSHGLTDGQLVKRGGGSFQTAFFSSEL